MIPKEFFTMESMLTLLGAVTATFVVCNGCQKAFNFNPKWLGLFVALIISLFGVYSATDNRIGDYFVGVINGFLIYCTAGGATEAGAKISGSSDSSAETKTYGDRRYFTTKRGFFTSWFN